MRLTLRTLLAYLDDTLEPGEIKPIGQKVAESDAAQELIARIKQVTRRRRLTTPPPTGPGAFDPNTIAEYLDNTLPPDQVADLEKTCLDSDVHLAEVAACHQILTLVLGEPALVPPTAKERMYGLVSGPESQRRRAPAPAAVVGRGPASEDYHGEDETLMGLPYDRRNRPWLPWLLVATIGCLMLAVGLAIGLALSSREPVHQVAVSPTTAAQTPPPPPPTQNAHTEPPPPPPTQNAHTEPPPPPPPPVPPTKTKSGAGHVELIKGVTNLLLRNRPDKAEWVRLQPDSGTVAPGDRLVSLPGFRSQLRFDGGTGLYLWGNLPDLVAWPILESAVTLHPPTDADLDFTLDRGRVVLTNDKASGAAKVRLRFNEEKPGPAEVWELTLEEPGTEVGTELFGFYSGDVTFKKGAASPAPGMLLNLMVLRGQAQVKAGGTTYSVRAPAFMTWDNSGQGARPPAHLESADQRFWDRTWPQTKTAEADSVALKELVIRPFDKKPAELVLKESLGSEASKPASRALAVFSLAALDDVSQVLDALADEDEARMEVRGVAVDALRHYIGRGAAEDQRLYQVLTDEKHYTPDQAETVMQMLHGIPAEQMSKPETWETLIDGLRSSKSAIRTLAYWHLYRLVPEGRDPKYNPAGDSRHRELAYQTWKKLVPDGKLPPAPPKQPR